MQLSLGFSPCPNDTFIFDKMVNQQSDSNDNQYKVEMQDVETLNQWAFQEKLDVSKLSYSAFFHLSDKYELLDSGSALGFGVGPLLITTKEKMNSIKNLEDFLMNAKIAIPGKFTTANLLLSLAFPIATNKKELVFNEIEAAVLNDEFDAGLIIHENRFTYAERGLAKIMDCGAWWEEVTGQAIPLGGIVVRKSLPLSVKKQVQQDIKLSLEASWENYPILSDFVRCNAQEMSEEVMRKHINLYVNEYSISLQEKGIAAVETLFKKAFEAKLISSIPEQFKI